MPGAAPQTTGTALTARLAVYPGVDSAIRSSGMSSRRSMSRGQSPSTVTCQPPGRRSHAASISVEQYHVALKPSSSVRLVAAHDVHPLPGDRAGRDRPGGDLDVADRRRHLSGRLDRVERHTRARRR